jgi:hypothetical protein
MRAHPVAQAGPDRDHRQQHGHERAADVPPPRHSVSLVNVAPDGVRPAAIDYAERIVDLAEILVRIDAQERPRRTVLLARVSLLRDALRIERRVLAQVALDGDHILVGRVCLLRRRMRGRLLVLTRKSFELACQLEGRRGVCAARRHGDSVIRTLRSAIEAADANPRIDLDVAQRVAKDGSRRAARQAFGVLAMQADLRRE